MTVKYEKAYLLNVVLCKQQVLVMLAAVVSEYNVQVIIPSEGSDVGKDARECVLNDDDCPLAILLQHPPSKGKLLHF